MEDFGTAGVKLLHDFGHFCIGKFNPDIFILVRRYPVHYHCIIREIEEKQDS